MRTDLNLLRVLLAIYEEGNVTSAARVLGISQPAASAALGRLRGSLDDPLFVRSGSSMIATTRALSIIDKTREVIAIIDRDILNCPVDEILRTKVYATIVGGKVVWTRD